MTPVEAKMILDKKYMALNLTKSPTDADDIIQESVIAVIRNIDKFRSMPLREQHIYLNYIVKNKFIDWYRKLRRRNSIDTPIVYDDRLPSYYLYERAQHPEIYSRLEMDEVRKIWDKEPICDALRLYLNGYSMKEIAEIQDTSINTVLGRVRYGRDKLRKRLYYGPKKEKRKNPSD